MIDAVNDEPERASCIRLKESRTERAGDNVRS